MTWTAALCGVVAMAVAVSAVPGCDRDVGGDARSAAGQTIPSVPGSSASGDPTTDPVPSLRTILPDADQWFAILGSQPQLSPLTVTGGEALGRQDAIGDWSNPDCLGVVDAGLESVFSVAPVTAVLDGYPTSETQVAVIAYRDAASATALFGPMADRWDHCRGKTVVDSSVTPPFATAIGDVRTASTVVSTTLTVLGDHQQVFQRALAAAGRCLIDVGVSVSSGPAPTPVDAAIQAATTMQDKAADAGC